MTFKYKEQEYEVEIIKKNNINTYIRIKNDHIYITTSYFTTKTIIKNLLEKNRKSIEKMLEKNNQRKERQDKFYLLGIPYKIIITDQKEVIIDKENKIIITKSYEELEKYLKKEYFNLYQEHLIEYYQNFKENIPLPKLKIRKMKTRWGVCNTKNCTITLNLELIHYEINCLDYVIVHELSHLLVPNHSKKFWSIVEKYYPNYKKIRKKLRE